MARLAKKSCFVLILVLLVIGFIEGAVWVMVSILNGRTMSLQTLSAERASIAATRMESKSDDSEPESTHEEGPGSTKTVTVADALHPFLGFVHNPKKMPHVNPIGFWQSSMDLPVRDPGSVIVGIFGGSFAEGVSVKGWHALEQRLTAIPEFSGRQVRPFCYALGGYKQPQQLMTLAWLLVNTARFDIVICVDGFNEVALPPAENIPKGINPFYPRNWALLTGNIDRESLIIAGEIAVLKQQRADWANRFNKKPLALSPSMNTLWDFFDQRFEEQISELTVRYDMTGPIEPDEVPYDLTGQSVRYDSEEAMYADLACFWADCSIQMARLCEANGIRFFHFLQPNQYLEGSKVIGDAERRVAIKENHLYKPGVEKGYPHLIEQGRRLVAEGIWHADLSAVFTGIETPYYVDDCCHLNDEGYTVIGEVIGRFIEQLTAARRRHDPTIPVPFTAAEL